MPVRSLGVMHGDGIGPEIVPAAVRVADAALAGVTTRDLGGTATCSRFTNAVVAEIGQAR